MPGTLKTRSKSESALRNGMANSRVLSRSTVCVLAQNLRTDQTPIQTKELSNILRSHTGKRRTHRAEITCFEDRMLFKRKNCISRKTFRDQLLYRDIIVPYRCVEHPNIFMLSVRAKDGKSVYYETYKCKNLADADKIGNIILNATSNPAKVYCDAPVTNSHRSLRDSPRRAQSVPQVNNHASLESLRNETPIRDRSSSSERSWSSRRDEKQYTPQSMAKSPLTYKSPLFVDRANVERVQMVQMSSTNPELYQGGNGTTTYFEYDPVNGAEFNEKGPIFMFLERFPATV